MSFPVGPGSAPPTGDGGSNQHNNNNSSSTASHNSMLSGGGQLSFDGEVNDWELTNGNSSGDHVTEKSEEEMRQELKQLEDEMNTLRQVLHAKEKRANDLRRKLGVTPMQLISEGFYDSFKYMKDSTAVQKMTSSDTVQKIGQSYLIQGSKSAVTNCASYTKTGLSSIGSGMATGMGSLKNSRLFSSMYGFRPSTTEEENYVEVINPVDPALSTDHHDTSG